MIDITQEEIMKNWGVDNSDNPLVTISCTAYNHEKYIAQALDGFLMQKTNFPFEVIIHDDASIDNTAAIIREYEMKYPKIIKPIYEKENQYSKGAGSLGQIMIPLYKGKYIAYCEGDDYWINENKLQMQVDFIKNNPNYTMVCHNANVISSDGKFIKKFSNLETSDLSIEDVISSWIIPTASMLVQRNCVLNKPIIPNAPQGDIIIHIECADKGKIRYIQNVMSCYRWLTPNSATVSVRKNRLDYWKRHEMLWMELNKHYNYKYKDLIDKKISYAEKRIKIESIIQKFKFLQWGRSWYQQLRLLIKKI